MDHYWSYFIFSMASLGQVDIYQQNIQNHLESNGLNIFEFTKKWRPEPSNISNMLMFLERLDFGLSSWSPIMGDSTSD